MFSNIASGGIENTVGWFENIGLPGFLAYGAGLVELIGGIALIIGLFSRVVSGLLGLIMVGAIVKVKLAAYKKERLNISKPGLFSYSSLRRRDKGCY